MNIVHTNKYKIKNYLTKNINLNYDIFIYKPEFLTKNISNAQFCLTNADGSQFNELEGLKFNIVFGFCSIYSNNFVSNTDIFEYSNIPFEYIVYHQGFLVIYDIPVELGYKILEYELEITWTESQTLQRYPSNTIPPTPFEMKWSTGLEEKNHDINSLRIMAGMIGSAFNYAEYDLDYVKSNGKIIYAKSNVETTDDLMFNIQYIGENKNWIGDYYKHLDQYSINKVIKVLIEKKRQMANRTKKLYEMIGETYKAPINNIKSIDTYSFISTNFISLGDAIGSIQLICNNSKYQVNKICVIKYNLVNITNITGNVNPVDGGQIYEEKAEKYEMELNSNDLGYKVLGMGKFFVIPTVGNNKLEIVIEFELVKPSSTTDYNQFSNDNQYIISNEFDDFWIQIDRNVLNTEPRIKLAQMMTDYEEYPIVDICEYFTKRINFIRRPSFDNQINPNIQNINDYMPLFNQFNEPINDIPQNNNNQANQVNNNIFNEKDKTVNIFNEFIKYEPSNYLIFTICVVSSILLSFVMN